jgi:hypothetical protein
MWPPLACSLNTLSVFIYSSHSFSPNQILHGLILTKSRTSIEESIHTMPRLIFSTSLDLACHHSWPNWDENVIMGSMCLYHYIVHEFLNLNWFHSLPDKHIFGVIQTVDFYVRASTCRSSDQNRLDPTAVRAWIRHLLSRARGVGLAKCWMLRDSPLRWQKCSSICHLEGPTHVAWMVPLICIVAGLK